MKIRGRRCAGPVVRARRTRSGGWRSVVAAGPLLALLVLPACDGAPPAEGPGERSELAVADASPYSLAPEAEAFWSNLRVHCGRAHPGGLTLEPPGDDMLTGTEQLIVHFRECGRDTIRVPFHIEVEETGDWDRSRTWLFIRTARGLELRHDHRHEDGTEDEVTWYGAFTRNAGAPGSQEFILEDRRAADGSELGWRVEMEPGERYTYGTIRAGDWTWRVDFDLSREVPPPPAPWGH